MATYTDSFSLAEAQTGAGLSGQYPLREISSTYTPDTTMYVKIGDVIQYTITEDDGGTVHYANASAQGQDTDPDPTDFTNGTGSQSSGSTWSYTVVSGTEDLYFDWFFFGSTDHATSGKKYSQTLTHRRVSITNSSLSAGSVVQGGTIDFSVSGLTGLLASSGNAHKLYVILQKGGSNFTTVGSGGVSWSAGSSYLGTITRAATSVTLTVGASMPTGTYKAYVGHYNSSASGNNAFFGAGNRLDSSPPEFEVTAPPDTDPDEFEFTNPTASTVTRATTVSSSVTLAGMGGASTVTAITSGFTATANGTAISAGSAVPQNATIVFSTTSSSTYGGSVTGTIQIGDTTSEEWEVETQAAPAAGSAASGVSGTSAYGVAILKPGAATQIFNQNMRVTNLIATGSVSLSKNGAGNVDSSNIAIPDTIISTTSAYAILYHVVSDVVGGIATVREDRMFPIVDTSNNNFKFRLQNITGNVSATAYWSLVRY